MLPVTGLLVVKTCVWELVAFPPSSRWTPVGRNSGLLENVPARAFVVQCNSALLIIQYSLLGTYLRVNAVCVSVCVCVVYVRVESINLRFVNCGLSYRIIRFLSTIFPAAVTAARTIFRIRESPLSYHIIKFNL